ncbi:MAG: hydrogenase expression/formation protein HypE [Candidatus Auribacterota bacterium]|nr:hydrogenase expression/formation protein HypE [Candidatus Auribacterota bacterium]
MKKRIITLEDGSGGREARDLIEEIILPDFSNPHLTGLPDAAVIPPLKERLAFTTDSFVVSPLFFPGGDIGTLAICGTVNDLAVSGARPLYLTCSLIIEEGLEIETLKRVVSSMGKWAKRAGVSIVTGDTKVVEAGNADKLYINTSGIGILPDDLFLSPDRITIGDTVIVSGTIGDHGLAILAAREKLDISSQLFSDCAPLNNLTAAMLETGAKIKFMRDPTRGGLAAVLNELVDGRDLGIELIETAIPIRPKVRAALEILGLDPLALANEGKLCAIVAEDDADRLIKAMREDPIGSESRIIGRVVRDAAGMVILKTESGGRRIVDWPRGEPIPRIC